MSNLGQLQSLSQKQIQRMSQRQIQAVNMLAMSIADLRSEIYRVVNENPALEIVKDPLKEEKNKEKLEIHSPQEDALQYAIDSTHSEKETLQHHLMEQLGLEKLSKDEYELSEKLIYNLDKNGFYGSKLSPESLLDKNRPSQNKEMLQRCLKRIQRLDPIGTCCRNYEESLLVQAKELGTASKLTMFILQGHLDFLDPPVPSKIEKKLLDFQENWHSKTFATKILLDEVDICEEEIEDSLNFIRNLNPFPASNYDVDIRVMDIQKPDVVVSITKVTGKLLDDDFQRGKVTGGFDYYFQVKYASGILPEIRVVPDMAFDKESIDSANAFIKNIEYCQSTLVYQTCAIIKFQKEFFTEENGKINALTRKQIAQYLGVSESTISRASSKKGSKYLQTEFGLYPFSMFFISGVKSANSEEKISSKEIIEKITEILKDSPEPLSDNQLTKQLNEMGIKIARRTVAKYRQRAGINNSYLR